MTLKSVENLHTLYNNPFLLEPVFPAFFEALGAGTNGVVLSYLVLPLVLPVHTRKALTGLKNGVSTLLTFTAPTNKDFRERFLGLGIRVEENRQLTNACLQYNIDLGSLIVSGDLGVEVAVDRKPSGPSNCPADMVKAASKLGQIFRPHSIPMVFAELGIANL